MMYYYCFLCRKFLIQIALVYLFGWDINNKVHLRIINIVRLLATYFDPLTDQKSANKRIWTCIAETHCPLAQRERESTAAKQSALIVIVGVSWELRWQQLKWHPSSGGSFGSQFPTHSFQLPAVQLMPSSLMHIVIRVDVTRPSASSLPSSDASSSSTCRCCCCCCTWSRDVAGVPAVADAAASTAAAAAADDDDKCSLQRNRKVATMCVCVCVLLMIMIDKCAPSALRNLL